MGIFSRVVLLIGLIAFYQVHARMVSDSIPNSTKKTSVAVLNLEPRRGLSDDEILSVSDRLRGELITTGKFNVLERAQMGMILQEQGFQQTGACSEASCIVEVGQLLAVHKMVSGSIGKVGKMYSINLKIIDVATGTIERQVSNDVRCGKEKLISFYIGNAARMLAGLEKEKQPLLSRKALLVPAGVVLIGGGAALTYLILNPKGDPEAPEKTQEIQLEVPVR